MSSTPNSALRSARLGLLMSQDDLARALREAGVPGASKRLVQRWEAGEIGTPRPLHARALERVTGLPIETLGFASPVPLARVSGDGHGGHDLAPVPGNAPAADGNPVPAPAPRNNYSGVWLSRYEYFSSGRDGTYTGLHYVTVLQHGSRLTVRSLPGSSASPLAMDLEVDGNVVTGTWSEQTAPDGYYQGARYHGAIQLLVQLTGRRMTGKWVGFGKEFDINTGPWELVLQDASTSRATLEKYNHAPVE
ncbi:helix-turn-helix transcriptional regulator [Streptomyces litchfieldiae]|uniref:Helix-turn-helix transcriptional regulator n=1 Tax=Streptomyces litchfieldiae TaxID=3075543 RepID=A0ABU2N157_9ACTN|nr:helix-turn-helix transcriptional regulator [Streptomyces sp. DSM 44938]MDT0347643.1 helix-turn-helix transcriptional regulator [Streptomyces sp. DSM 44938]